MEEKFITELADILETEPGELEPDTEFKADRFDWDSLKGYAILLMLEEEFGVNLSVDDFIKVQTIRDLFGYVSKES
jgi:acyl carrier protein